MTYTLKIDDETRSHLIELLNHADREYPFFPKCLLKFRKELCNADEDRK